MQPHFDKVARVIAHRCAMLACRGCAAGLPFTEGAGGRIMYHVCRAELVDCTALGIYREFGLRMEFAAPASPTALPSQTVTPKL